MRLKKLLTFVFLTNLVCVFPAGHGIIPLGFFEPILISGAISGETDSRITWIYSAILLTLGQILIVIALTQKIEKTIIQLGLAGLSTLMLATVCVYMTMEERLWTVTLLTAIPFIIMARLFLKESFKD